MISPGGNVFVSYTTRDGCISARSLQKLQKTLGRVGEVYIDLLSNPNCTNPQSHVIRSLLLADQVLLVKSPCVFDSPWVRLELRIANALGKALMTIPHAALEFSDHTSTLSSIATLDLGRWAAPKCQINLVRPMSGIA